jgi:hypothetical protein
MLPQPNEGFSMAANNHDAKLTDAQLVVLSSAAEHAGGFVLFPEPAPPTAGRTMTVLLRRGLVAEVPAGNGDSIWRRDEAGKPLAAKITAAGLAAIGVTDEGKGGEVHERDAAASDAPTMPSVIGKPGTKRALIMDLMQRNDGATLGELVEATGWLPHTTRAALTGLRKKGLTLDRAKRQDGSTTYRLEPQQAAV